MNIVKLSHPLGVTASTTVQHIAIINDISTTNPKESRGNNPSKTRNEIKNADIKNASDPLIVFVDFPILYVFQGLRVPTKYAKPSLIAKIKRGRIKNTGLSHLILR